MIVSKILIVSATAFEILPLLEKYQVETQVEGLYEISGNDQNKISVLITGIGMVNTAYMMGRYLRSDYDLIINAGICGAFDRSIKIGEVVNVITDTISEMGAEDGDNFIKYEEMKLGGTNVYHQKEGAEIKAIHLLKKVKGITVNKVHGNELSVEKAKKLFESEVESMEGAAFFRACEGASSFLQIRSVSNYVEKRDKSKWDLPLAIKNLNDLLIQILQ